MEDIGGSGKMLRRTFAQEMSYLERITPTQWRVKPGFVENMCVPGVFYVNERLETRCSTSCGLRPRGPRRFPPRGEADRQRRVPARIAEVHRAADAPGYGFAIGNVAAFDMSDPTAVFPGVGST